VSAHLGERLSAFLDGEMSAADRTEAQAHLRECAHCARAMEEMASVDALARELTVEAPEGYFDALPGRVRARLRAPHRRRIAPMAIWAAAAAAVVMFAVVTPQMVLKKDAAPAPAAAAARETPAPRSLAVPAPTALPGAAPRAAAEGFEAAPAPAVPAPAAPALGRNEPRPKSDVAKAVVPPRPPAESRATAAEEGRDELAAAESVPRQMTYAAPPPATAVPGPAAAPAKGVADTRARADAEDKSQVQAQEAPTDAAAPQVAARKEGQAAGRVRAGGAPEGFEAPAGRRLRGEERYEVLEARRPTTAAEARTLARAWEAFARETPADPHADEARVRAIEATITAWRLGSDAADLAAARTAAAAYLAADRATQKARVRALVDALPPGP
jgi:hypothetical protein